MERQRMMYLVASFQCGHGPSPTNVESAHSRGLDARHGQDTRTITTATTGTRVLPRFSPRRVAKSPWHALTCAQSRPTGTVSASGDQPPPAKRLSSTHNLTVRVQMVRLLFALRHHARHSSNAVLATKQLGTRKLESIDFPQDLCRRFCISPHIVVHRRVD